MVEDYNFRLISLLSSKDDGNYKTFKIKECTLPASDAEHCTQTEFIETFSNIITTVITDHKNNINDIPLDNLYTFIACHLSNPIIQNIVLNHCIKNNMFFDKYKIFITKYIVDNKIFSEQLMIDLLNSLPIMKSFIYYIMQYNSVIDKPENIIIELIEYFEDSKINMKELCDGIVKFFKSDETLLDYFMISLEKIVYDKNKNNLTHKLATKYAYILSQLSLSAEHEISKVNITSETLTDMTKKEYTKIISPWHKLLFFTNVMIYLSVFDIIKNYGYNKHEDGIKLFELYLDIYHLTIKRINNILFEFVIVDCVELLFNICKLGIIPHMNNIYYNAFNLFSNIIAGLDNRITNPHIRFNAVKTYNDILYYNTRFGIITKIPKNMGFAVLKYLTDVKYISFLFSDEIFSHISDVFKILKKHFIDQHKMSPVDIFTFTDDSYDFDLDKIIPAINETIDIISKSLEHTITAYIHNSTNMFNVIMSTKYLTLINNIIENMNIGINIIHKFITNDEYIKLIHDVQKENKYVISSHIIAGINLSYSKYIDACLNDKFKINNLIKNNVINRIKYINIFIDMFKIFDHLAKNNVLVETTLNIDALEKFIVKYKLDVTHLVEFIDHKKDNLIENDLPDEFHDSIFMSVIKDPIMIPHSDDIHDKNSMLYYLSTTPVNPLTREKLNVDDVIEYNKNVEVVKKIKNFTDKKNKYLETLKKQ
jgi:hypothetical protein